MEFKEAVQVREGNYSAQVFKPVLSRLPMWSSTTKLLAVVRIKYVAKKSGKKKIKTKKNYRQGS